MALLARWFGQHVQFVAYDSASARSGWIRVAATVSEFTPLMQTIQGASNRAAEELLPLVYKELRQLAVAKMAGEAVGQTLQPTALVHEAWLRLGADAQPAWQNRAHFFSAAAEAMRRILIDRARKRRAQRHGGGLARINIDAFEVADGNVAPDELLLAINDALEKFAAQQPAKAELVKLRYFVGLNHAEAAQTLGISEVTAKRWWGYARAWLHEEIKCR